MNIWTRVFDLTLAVAGLVTIALGVRLLRGDGEAAPPSRTGKTSVGTEIDLHSMIAAPEEGSEGAWVPWGAGLRAPSGKPARLVLPGEAPAEFELSLDAKRVEGKDALALGLVFAGRPCLVILDGNGGQASWFEVKGGRKGLTENGVSYFEGPVLREGQASRITCASTRDGLRISVDGIAILDWRGPPGLLFVPDNWKARRENALFVGAWDSVFDVSRLRISSLPPAARPSR